MSTVAEALAWALKDAGITGEGITASAESTSDAYETLKQMLALWQVDNVYVYALTENSFAPTGALTYTVGSSGTIPIARPARIESAFWRSGGLDSPIEVLQSPAKYDAISQKTQPGDPQYLYYNPSYALGTLYLYPQPSTGTVFFKTQAQFPELANEAADLTLPPEYVLPIRTSLAVMMASMWGAPPIPEIAAIAASSWKIVKRNNLRIKPLGMPEELPGRIRQNIFTG